MPSLSDLCLACGLCCEGSLFRYVRLTPEEAERLSRVGLTTIRRRDGTPTMSLGCRGLQGLRCTLYEERPRGCRAYLCELGVALRDGRLGFEDAMERVRQARALVDEVAAHLPPTSPDDTDSVLQRAHRDGLLDGPEPLRRAEAFLHEHFLGRMIVSR